MRKAKPRQNQSIKLLIQVRNNNDDTLKKNTLLRVPEILVPNKLSDTPLQPEQQFTKMIWENIKKSNDPQKFLAGVPTDLLNHMMPLLEMQLKTNISPTFPSINNADISIDTQYSAAYEEAQIRVGNACFHTALGSIKTKYRALQMFTSNSNSSLHITALMLPPKKQTDSEHFIKINTESDFKQLKGVLRDYGKLVQTREQNTLSPLSHKEYRTHCGVTHKHLCANLGIPLAVSSITHNHTELFNIVHSTVSRLPSENQNSVLLSVFI